MLFPFVYVLSGLIVSICSAASAASALPSALLRSEVSRSSHRASPRIKLQEPKKAAKASHLDVRDEAGVSLRDRGATSWVFESGHPQLGSLIVTSVAESPEAPAANCGYLVSKVLQSIKFHLGRRRKSTFISDNEAELFSDLTDDQTGQQVLSDTMRVLGNYTLPEGIMAGSLWTIDDQNHYISCEQNILSRLEEHEQTDSGDLLIQGDMAVTSTLCHYSEESDMYADTGFALGTHHCMGMHECQFEKPDEAVHFCNNEPLCTIVVGKVDGSGCEGGLGCYMPRQGTPNASADWSAGGGRSYVKHCPGALLELQNAASMGLRDAGNRWENGEVSYCFSVETTEEAREAFTIAVEQVKRQVPCLRLNLAARIDDTRCTTVPSIIVTAKPSGCWSYVGQVSGKGAAWHETSQALNLDRGCELPGIALHQLGHALGMAHEQSRADRDNVMSLNTSNIQDGKTTEFGTSQDVVKYTWSGRGTCATKTGDTRIEMTHTDCASAGGEDSSDGAATAAHAATIAAQTATTEAAAQTAAAMATANSALVIAAATATAQSQAETATAEELTAATVASGQAAAVADAAAATTAANEATAAAATQTAAAATQTTAANAMGGPAAAAAVADAAAATTAAAAATTAAALATAAAQTQTQNTVDSGAAAAVTGAAAATSAAAAATTAAATQTAEAAATGDQALMAAAATATTAAEAQAADAAALTLAAGDMLIPCLMDLCEDGNNTYRPAPTNMCKQKVASMSIKMQLQDCRTARGSPDSEGATTHWTNCHFDLCADMGLNLAKPLSCANKLAHGYIEVPFQQCSNMGGSSIQQAVITDWVNCYFDFCSGAFDSSFDFLSLMMYSPHAWSHTGEELSLQPLGDNSEILSNIMGQRMGFSGMDVFHLGHMYNCWEQIKPDFDSKELSQRIISGEFFEFNGTCEDKPVEATGFQINGESGFMKHAACADLAHLCKNDTIGEEVRAACPVSCFQCMPNHGYTGRSGIAGECFDSGNTGIRFRDGPKANCSNLVHYCNHPAIGQQVRESCKLTCGGCELIKYAPFYDAMKECFDGKAEEDPQFTVVNVLSECRDLETYCQGHTDSFLVRHKCPHTCGLCGGEEPKPNKTKVAEVWSDTDGCERRRRFGYCSSRRRRMV